VGDFSKALFACFDNHQVNGRGYLRDKNVLEWHHFRPAESARSPINALAHPPSPVPS